MAGDNRAELEKVIEHYKTLIEAGKVGDNLNPQSNHSHNHIENNNNPSADSGNQETSQKPSTQPCLNNKLFSDHSVSVNLDSLKLEAAYYLIANMPGKYTHTSVGENPFRKVLPRLYSKSYDKLEDGTSYITFLIDSVILAEKIKTQRLSDLKHVTADYLIQNIDAAFAQWEKCPWKDDYTFEEFCQWVLPYRVGTEELEDWRAALTDPKTPGEDSLLVKGDMWGLATELLRNYSVSFHQSYADYPFHFTASEMNELRKGSCGDMARFTVQLMRSRGIPAGEEANIAWADRNSNHVWNSIILPGGKSIDIGHNHTGVNDLRSRISKIYRRGFTIRRDDPLYIYKETETLPSFFENSNVRDVTAEYGMPVSDIEIKGLRAADSKLAWLCTFNNSDWVPIAYAEINKDKAIFKDMGRGTLWEKTQIYFRKIIDDGGGIVYLPAFYKYGSVIPAANPVILYEDGSIKEIVADTSSLEIVTLKRKYYKHLDLDINEKALIGCRFEGANRPDFSEAQTLCSIEKQPSAPLTKLVSGSEKPFRYVRFISPDSIVSLAEVWLYSDSLVLDSKPFHPDKEFRSEAERLTDGDILTDFWIEKTGRKSGLEAEPVGSLGKEWIGFDLGSPRRISSIGLCPMTDDNEIVPGEVYELFYWDKRWWSAGRVTGENDGLAANMIKNPASVSGDGNLDFDQGVMTGNSTVDFVGSSDGGYTLSWRVPKGALLWLRNHTKGAQERIFLYEKGKQRWF